MNWFVFCAVFGFLMIWVFLILAVITPARKYRYEQIFWIILLILSCALFAIGAGGGGLR